MNTEIDDVNGSMRAVGGTFALLPHKRFSTDGRAVGLPREPLDKLTDDLIGELARIRSADLRDVLVVRSNRWAWRDLADVLQKTVSTVHKRFAGPSPLD